MGESAAVKLGPGLLYVAPVGTSEPTNASSALPSAWIPLGFTEEGSEIGFEQGFERVMVAESLHPVRIVATSQATSIKFELAQMTARNLSVAFNGGTIGSPSGGSVKFTPPDLGEEERIAIIWDSDDDEERWIFRQCIQAGSITIARRKAPDKATIPCEFQCEIPAAGGSPSDVWITDTLDYDDLH